MVSLNSNIPDTIETSQKQSINNDKQLNVSKKSISKKSNYTYNEKINTISDYFGVSKSASKYMFNRRRKGFLNEKTDNNLTWSVQLQNAFIKADNIENFKWKTLNFYDDIKILKEYNINIYDQSEIPIRNIDKINKNLKTDNDGEWTIVISNRKKINKKLLLTKIGFFT